MKARFPHIHPHEGNGTMAVPYVERYQFDAGYIQRLTAGEPATERHFVRYFGELLTVKLRVKRQQHLLEDARQETLLRVLTTLRKKGGIDTPHSLGAFVNSVCNNVLLEMYRAESKAPTLTDEFPDLPANLASIESEMVSDERRKMVRDVIGELPRKDQEVLRMIFFEERDKDEICRVFQVDREYLRVLLHRAKQRFRALFNRHQRS